MTLLFLPGLLGAAAFGFFSLDAAHGEISGHIQIAGAIVFVFLRHIICPFNVVGGQTSPAAPDFCLS